MTTTAPLAKTALVNLRRVEAGKYVHATGTRIEKRPRTRIGRTGFALPGWAVIRDGREIGRHRTLALAAESLSENVADALSPHIACPITRSGIAFEILTAVVAAKARNGAGILRFLASDDDYPAIQRDQMVESLRVRIGNGITSAAVRDAMKAAARSVSLI